MSRIAEAFHNHKAFIPFITCGDPDLDTTYRTVLAMAENGADLIELGIPFSDPTAEGPVIMGADSRALESGTTTDSVLELAAALRQKISIPMVFMTYANVVYSYGSERFMNRAAKAGMDGLILPDVPFEEREDFEPVCRACDMDLIAMIAPTSEKRIAAIARAAGGFVYMVSSLGVTGVRSSITTDIGAMTKLVRENTDVPCAVGFGISTPEQAAKMASLSDGAIVGSAIVKMIAQHGTAAPAPVGAFVREMASAVHQAGSGADGCFSSPGSLY